MFCLEQQTPVTGTGCHIQGSLQELLAGDWESTHCCSKQNSYDILGVQLLKPPVQIC